MKSKIHIMVQRIAGVIRQGARNLADDRGGEVIEYVLIAGLITVAAIAVIATVGTKVLARWTSTNSSM